MDLSQRPQPGRLLARGVCTHLHGLDFVTLQEFTPERGKRLDVLALGPKGEFWVIECKSSRSDFTSDTKWPGYLGWGDRFFWAVNVDFPVDILPDHTGLIFADAFDGHIIRTGAEAKLPPARRRALMLKFARVAARRDFALRHLDIAP